jgi:hypothetical protein
MGEQSMTWSRKTAMRLFWWDVRRGFPEFFGGVLMLGGILIALYVFATGLMYLEAGDRAVILGSMETVCEAGGGHLDCPGLALHCRGGGSMVCTRD